MSRLATIKASTLPRALGSNMTLFPTNITGHRLTSVPNFTTESIDHNKPRNAGRAVHSHYPSTSVNTLETNPRLIGNVFHQTKLGQGPLHLAVIILIGVMIYKNPIPREGRADHLTFYPPNKDRLVVHKISLSCLPPSSKVNQAILLGHC